MSLESRIAKELGVISAQGRAREIPDPDSQIASRIDLSSNDYLGLAADSRVLFASMADCEVNLTRRLGTSSSRVLAPPLTAHLALEAELADFLDTEDCLLFGSGYLANIGVLQAVIKRNDIVCSDQLIHASLIDGVLLSRCNNYRFKHNCMASLEDLLKRAHHKRNNLSEIFIIVESVYSMDGDRAPLYDICELAERYGANLIIDEAHAIGVFGRNGRGLYSELGKSNPHVILLGTLSKSLGSYGGIAATSKLFKRFLLSRARSFLFSTALPEFSPRGALKALEIINNDKTMGTRLIENANFFRRELSRLGVPIHSSDTHIQPILVGDEHKAITVSKYLSQIGVRVPAIRPPTVPPNSSRLRCSLSLSCENSSLLEAAEEIALSLKNHSLLL